MKVERLIVNGVDVSQWRKNSEELASLQGMPDSSVLILPAKIGKHEMIWVAY